MTNSINKKSISPSIIISLSFLIVILAGTILLKLPFSIAEGQSLSWINSLFISTSAVCVTGLSPVLDISMNFTTFGKIIIGLLIQIGGLGFVTIAIYTLSFFGVKFGISDRLLIKESLNLKSFSGLVKLVKSIVKITFFIEFIGFIISFIVFSRDFTFWEAIGISTFHSISSFNNAGFDLLGSNSLIGYQDNILLNINTTVLIILGGLGFLVIKDLISKQRWSKLTNHTKIVVKTTLSLLIVGTILTKVIEGSNISWLQSFFLSVTTRTAGFTTIDLNTLRSASVLLVIFLMIAGASPGSTGGGIKTTTIYTIFKTIKGFVFGKKAIVYNRKITDETKIRAFLLVILAILSIFLVSFILLIIEENNPNIDFSFKNILFESTSAFATVGLSMGITPYLMPLSKFVISVLMLFGRLGPLTIFSLFNKNWNRPSDTSVDYLPENIIIG